MRHEARRTGLPRWIAAATLLAACGGSSEPSASGLLEVTFTATGAEIPTGSALTIDARTLNLDIDQPTQFRLAAGPHTVTLSPTPNCLVDGATSSMRSVMISPDSTTHLAFQASCVSYTAQIRVTVTSSGPDPTPYRLLPGLTNGIGEIPDPIAVQVGDTGAIDHVVPGSQTLALGPVPSNCSVADGPTRVLTVRMGDSLLVQFDLTCNRPSGLGLALGPTVIQVDGAGIAPLSPGSLADWSPDNRKLAFFDRDTLWTIAPDGTGRTAVAAFPTIAINPSAIYGYPVWSPDGTRLAALGTSPEGTALYVIKADGSGLTALVSDAINKGNPRWSPDSKTIAFSSMGDLYLVPADGSSLRSLTVGRFPGAQAPAWSPGGDQLAFHSGLAGQPDIYVIDTAGTTFTLLTPGAETGSDPDWSSASNRIVYLSNDPLGTAAHLVTIRADGTSRLDLPVPGVAPRWSRDGSRLGFLADAPDCSANFCTDRWFPAVIAPDGTGFHFTPSIAPGIGDQSGTYLSWGTLQ